MTRRVSVIHVITSKAWGGLELYTVSLAKKLIDSGVKTAIYCLANTKVEREAKKLGIPVFYGIKQARISVKDILQLRHVLRQEHFDVVHAHTRQDVWLVSLATRFFGKKIPLIFSLYMSAPPKKDPLHRLIYSKVDVVTSSSETLNQQIKKNFPIKSSRVKLLRYGRDLFLLDRNTEERNRLRFLWKTNPKDLVVLTMCRLDPQKGVRELAESLLYLNQNIRAQVKIWIMGEPTLSHLDPNGQPVYEEQSKKFYEWLVDFTQQQEVRGRIELIPFQKNVVPYLEAADVFALLTYKETYSLSILDAMNHGLPVIGTNTGGTPEQVKDGERGLLVPPKDAQAVAQAISFYAENPAQRAQHGQAAKIWVQSEHNWNQTISKLVEIYTASK